MKKLFFSIVLLMLLVAVVIAALPARFIWQVWFQEQVSQLELQGISGQWWRGRAANINWYQQSIGQLRWVPSGLGLELSLIQPKAQVRTRLTSVNTTQVRLSLQNTEGQLEAELLPVNWQQSFLPVGQIDFELPQFEVQKDSILHISGEANWQNAALLGDVVVDLGDITINFSPRQQHTLLQLLNTDSEDVRLTGEGEIHADRYQVRLRLRALPGRPELQQQLQLLGSISSDGSVLLDFSGGF